MARAVILPATVSPRSTGKVGTTRSDPSPNQNLMNGKTAKLLRKFARTMGSNLRHTKAAYLETPRNHRHEFKQEVRRYIK